MALEAALAMVLLVGAGLLLDSYARMRRTDLGVDPDRVLTFWLRPSEVRVPPSAAPGFIRQVLDAIGRVPGVAAVTVDGGAPVSGSARSELFIVGRPEPAADAPLVLRHYVGPDHFRVLRIPLLRGRVFTAGDSAGAPRVAVISVSAARRFWPGQDPIGERVWFGTRGFDRPDSSAEIVGVVGDIASEPLDLPVNRSDFYTPYTQFTYASRMVMVRTARDPGGVLTGIRHAVLQVDPDLPLHDVQSLPDRIEASWARQRFDATLLGGLAALAVFLAASGTFAVVACAVAQREREIGIRLALGADPVAILRLVVGQGMVFPLAGTVAGTGAALMLSRLLQASLYQITPADPAVLAATVTLLLAVTLLACLLPARRATRLDPLAVLREE
jgi:putative ABC transport system permease protein